MFLRVTNPFTPIFNRSQKSEISSHFRSERRLGANGAFGGSPTTTRKAIARKSNKFCKAKFGRDWKY